MADGDPETWFQSATGRLIAFVTNRERAMVVVMDEVGDPGEHLTDPSAGDTSSEGFFLSNGQHDSYPDRDTVPIEIALRVVGELIEGESSSGAPWSNDR